MILPTFTTRLATGSVGGRFDIEVVFDAKEHATPDLFAEWFASVASFSRWEGRPFSRAVQLSIQVYVATILQDAIRARQLRQAADGRWVLLQ